jgi:outer membrane protein TolC/predicted PurR-regulated permease PerM
MLVTILVTCLTLFLFQKIIWLVVPGLLALMIYYCLRPLIDRLVLRGVSHGMAVTATVVVVLVITVGVVCLSVPALLSRVSQLQGTVDRYVGGGQTLLRKTTQALEEAAPVLKRASLSHQVESQIREFSDQFAERNLGKLTLELLKWVPSLFLVPYLTYFMLKDVTGLKKYLMRSVPNAFFEKSLLLFARLDESLRSFFQGLLVLTFLDTFCLASGLWVLGVSPAFLLGLAAAVLSWIPYLGSVIGCIMVVLVAATDFPSQPSIAYSCLALFLCVRLLDDFVFLPLTIGRKLHIHPLLSVLMFFLGATVAGGTGLVLALPVLGVVSVVGEVVAQVVTDRRLRFRYRAAREFAAASARSRRAVIAVVVISFALAKGPAAEASGGGKEAQGQQASSVVKGLKAPASPDTLWPTPDLRTFAEPLREQLPSEVDPRKEYELAELIDLAERANPETKVAWARAKEAAAAVGLAQSEYYPVLALKASGNWVNLPVPLPESPNQAGYLSVEAQEAHLVAVLEWVLLDFGRRAATVGAARERLLAANLGFNARHLEIVFKVQSAFYRLCTVRGRMTVAQTALASAAKVQEAAEERFKHELATAPDVSLARQQAVQAAFDLEEVNSKERDAQVSLAESIGILPTTPLHVADFSRLALPTNLEETVERFIDRTLEQRPDLLARVAILREKEAEIRRARAAYWPTLVLAGNAGGAYERSQLTLDNGSASPWVDTKQPIWGVGLALTWSLFEGGARKRKLEIARSEREAAQHELEDSRDKAISQVWRFYTDTKLAIRRLEVAAALVEASEKSYQQTYEGYQHGLTSLVDVLAARRELSRAQYTQLDTRATLLESTAALAFASGDLGPRLLNQNRGP